MNRLPILIIAVCAALLIAGCGSSDDSSSTGSSGTAATNADSTSAESANNKSKSNESPNAESTGTSNSKVGLENPQQAKAAEESGVRLGGKPGVPKGEGPPPKQLTAKDWVPGVGAVAKNGDKVTVQYVGINYKSGKEFDSSWDRNEPFTFTLGAGEVIPGWDQGLVGMKVNGRREMVIPPDLAYGSTGQPPKIPPNETLIFMVDLVAIN